MFILTPETSPTILPACDSGIHLIWYLKVAFEPAPNTEYSERAGLGLHKKGDLIHPHSCEPVSIWLPYKSRVISMCTFTFHSKFYIYYFPTYKIQGKALS